MKQFTPFSPRCFHRGLQSHSR